MFSKVRMIILFHVHSTLSNNLWNKFVPSNDVPHSLNPDNKTGIVKLFITSIFWTHNNRLNFAEMYKNSINAEDWKPIVYKAH